jgi:hypothetical protein
MKMLLIHGRDDPDEDMQDWGYRGQTLEGVAYIHWTYGNLTVGFVSDEAARAAHGHTGWPFFDKAVLEMHQHDDLIRTNNMSGSGADYSYFGDWGLVEDSFGAG